MLSAVVSPLIFLMASYSLNYTFLISSDAV